MVTAQRRQPLLLGAEHVADVAGHGREVDRQGRQARHVAMNPSHPLPAWLGPGDIQ
jgi:hypothetical protein